MMTAPIAGDIVWHHDGGRSDGAFFAGETSMGDIDSELALAARYVAEARHIVARQRRRILRLKAMGSATPDHELTLQAFAGALAELEGRAQDLIEMAKRLDRPQRRLS
jgi:hypothetical protein